MKRPFSKDKPLIDMTPEELQASFDTVGLTGNIAILENARQNTGSALIIACAVLLMPGNVESVAYWAPEYGDEDGISQVRDWIVECDRTSVLKKGERLMLRVVHIERTNPPLPIVSPKEGEA